jgi:hypothetical protein
MGQLAERLIVVAAGAKTPEPVFFRQAKGGK